MHGKETEWKGRHLNIFVSELAWMYICIQVGHGTVLELKRIWKCTQRGCISKL